MRLHELHEQVAPRPLSHDELVQLQRVAVQAGSLLIWVDKDLTWRAPRGGRPGRPAVFSDAAIQLCLSIKVLFKLPLRQTAGMIASLLRLAGLDWPVPDFSTLCRRQETLAVQVPYRWEDRPLNLLVPSRAFLRNTNRDAVVCLEATGGQEWQFWEALGAEGVMAREVPPAQGKACARSRGRAQRPTVLTRNSLPAFLPDGPMPVATCSQESRDCAEL